MNSAYVPFPGDLVLWNKSWMNESVNGPTIMFLIVGVKTLNYSDIGGDPEICGIWLGGDSVGDDSLPYNGEFAYEFIDGVISWANKFGYIRK